MMWRNLLPLLLLLLLHVCPPSTAAEGDLCEGGQSHNCDCKVGVVICTCSPDSSEEAKATITGFPYDLPPGITKLTFKHCDLINITQKVPYTALTDLDMSAAKISLISDEVFSNLTKLRSLRLEHNALDGDDIKKEIFSGLAALEKLDLSDNSITELKNNASFSGSDMPALKTLDLSNNKLSKLASRHFHALSTLETLNLQSNEVVDMDFSGAGDTFSGLKTLNLEGAWLTALELKQLTGMGKLETLNLKGSKVQSVAVDAFSEAKGVKTVDLSGSKLTPTLSAAFQNLTSLTDLDVSANQLYWMDGSAINWNTLTGSFKVQGNQWECGCRNNWLINQTVVKNSADTESEIKCAFPAAVEGKSVFDSEVEPFFEADCPCPPQSPIANASTTNVAPVSTEEPKKSSSSSAHDTGVGFAIGLVVGLLLAVVAVVVWCRYIRARGPRASYTHHMNA